MVPAGGNQFHSVVLLSCKRLHSRCQIKIKTDEIPIQPSPAFSTDRRLHIGRNPFQAEWAHVQCQRSLKLFSLIAPSLASMPLPHIQPRARNEPFGSGELLSSMMTGAGGGHKESKSLQHKHALFH